MICLCTYCIRCVGGVCQEHILPEKGQCSIQRFTESVFVAQANTQAKQVFESPDLIMGQFIDTAIHKVVEVRKHQGITTRNVG